MKIRLLPIITASFLVLQGCALTPSEIQALGIQGQVEIKQPHKQASACLSRQLDHTEGGAHNITKSLNAAGLSHKLHQSYGYSEIIGDVHVGGSYYLTIRPDGPNKSNVEIYISDNLMSPELMTQEIKKAASACNTKV